MAPCRYSSGMSSKHLLVLALSTTLCAPITVVGAAAPGPKARIFAKYDLNKNNVIDGNEIAAVRAAFKADPKGEFARYDANNDGRLDDAEVAGIKPPGQGGKKGGKKETDGSKKPESSQK